ncbi:MAG: winged helix-turn-helix domain-containing protein, partial [Blastocatellia bacterium]
MTASRYLAYEFGPFQLDTVKRLLTKDGAPVPLTPKAFDILIALIEEPGKTVDKDLLIRKVWQDCIVEEGNLTFNIHKLRRALGEGPKEHNYILTVPGKGYRFVANVRELLPVTAPFSPGAPVHGNGKLPASPTSLAVLPFRSSENIEEGGYLGVSLADALITRLGHLKQVVVRPTSAVRRYATEEKD